MKFPPPPWVIATVLPSFLAGATGGLLFATRDDGIDWAATGTMLQGVAALLAAGAAVWGVNQWRKELRYKRNSELAVQVMVAVEGIARSLEQARRTPEDFEIDKAHGNGRVLQAFSYKSRLLTLTEKDYPTELAGLSNHVSAIFGEQHRKAIEGLVAAEWTVRMGLEQAIGLREAARQDPPMHNAYELIEALSDTLFPSKDGTDGVGKGISYAAGRIRELFKTSL